MEMKRALTVVALTALLVLLAAITSLIKMKLGLTVVVLLALLVLLLLVRMAFRTAVKRISTVVVQIVMLATFLVTQVLTLFLLRSLPMVILRKHLGMFFLWE